MIKFLKKIRKQLFSEVNIGKFLAYAIGEIILIVIGILIALAIDNMSNNISDKKNEEIYLKGLRKEFETSKFKLNELIKVNKRNYDGAKKIVKYISNKDTLPSEKEFSVLMYNTFSNDIAFNPNNSLLNEMINTGNLKKITNTQLRIQLTNWISTIDDISNQEKEMGIQREKVIDILRRNEYNLTTILKFTTFNNEIGFAENENEKSNLNLLNSTEFENNILMFILSCYATEKAHYIPLMKQLDTILETLNKEINK